MSRDATHGPEEFSLFPWKNLGRRHSWRITRQFVPGYRSPWSISIWSPGGSVETWELPADLGNAISQEIEKAREEARKEIRAALGIREESDDI